MTTDLFEEFDQTAAEYGWTRLGQPESHTRRYGKADGEFQVTVRVYANKPGTAIMRVSKQMVGGMIHRLTEDHRGAVAGKRGIAIDWLRGVR